MKATRARRFVVALAASGALLGLLVGACDDEEAVERDPDLVEAVPAIEDAGEDGRATDGGQGGTFDSSVVLPCSNGPRYAPDAALPFGPSPTEMRIACTPHCGDNPRGLYGLNVSALPSGDCPIVGYECDMGAHVTCPGYAYGPFSHYRCTCQPTGWACLKVAAAGQACTKVPDDAGD